MKLLNISNLKKSVVLYTLLGMFLVIIFTLYFVTVSTEKIQEKREANYSQLINNNVKHVFDYFIKSYTYRLKSIIETTDIVELFEKQDREAVLKLLKPKFDLMSEENKYFDVMHIHNNDGSSFLRVHKPNDYGDEIAQKRAMLREIHQNHTMLFGYETGVHAISYRIMTPIFNKNNKYIGAIEIGLNPNFMQEAIFNLNGLPSIVLIKKDLLVFSSRPNDILIDGYAIESTINEKLEPIVQKLQLSNKLANNLVIKINDAQYVTHILTLQNYSGEDSVKIVFFHDITGLEGFLHTSVYQFEIFIFFIFLVIAFFIYRRVALYEEHVEKVNTKHLHDLEVNEEYLQSIFDATPDIMITTNGEELDHANLAMLDFFNVENIEVFKQKHSSICKFFLAGEDCLEAEIDGVTWLEYILNDANSIHKVCMQKNEKKHYFVLKAKKLKIDSQQRCIVTFNDITELEEVSQRLEKAVSSTNDGLWDWNLETDELYFSPQWKKQLGYEDFELENSFKTWENLIHPDDKERVVKDFTANINQETDLYENIHRLLHKNGSWVWIFDRGQTKFDHNDKAVRMLGFHTDITKQKEQELEIKDLSLLLNNVLNSFTNLIFVKDAEFRYVECNKAFERFIGLRREEIIGKSDYDFFDSKEMADFFRQKDTEMLALGITKNNYEWVTYPDGQKVYLLTSKAPLYDEHGNVIGLVGNSIDVTQEKRLEEELHKSEKLFGQFMDHVPAQIYILDQDSVIYANKSGNEYFGKDSIIGSGLKSLLEDAELSAIEMIFDKVVQNGVYGGIGESKNYKGERIKLRDLAFRIDNEDGSDTIGLISIDITQEYKANKEIQRLLSAFERTNISVVMTNLAGNIEYVNPSWCKVTGYSQEELIGQNPRIVKSGYVSPRSYEKMWKRLLDGKVWNSEIKNIAKDGHEFWEDSTIIPSFDKGGNVDGYIAFKVEINEKVLLKQELQDKDEIMIAQSRHAAMGEMISMIAHQWRQPISVIAMDANNILADIELDALDNDELAQEARDIIYQTGELSKTIDDFREFFKPNRNAEVTILREVIDDALNILGKSLENNNIDVTFNIDESLEIQTYSRELMQVIINLIKNAKEILIEKQIESKKISIDLFEDSAQAILEISDNAGGVSDTIRNKIFDPYFTTKGEKNGTGLGLYMSKTIIEKHLDGRLSVSNTNEGAKFKIVLPMSLELQRSELDD